MTHYIKKHKSFGVAGLLAGSFLLFSAVNVFGQESTEVKQPVTKRAVQSGGRDPFKKYEPPRTAEKKSGYVMIPSIQERISEYKAQKLAAMKARTQAPKPTTALLLSELQVVGITRTPRGYAAIVEAMPIKLSYVIYPGEKFYDGQLVAIEDNRLVFRREIVLSDGRRERSVEMKSLRQQNSVDAMSTAKVVSSNPLVESPSAQKSTTSNQP